MFDNLIKTQGLPAFSQFDPTQVVPTIEGLLAENRRRIEELLTTVQPYTWDSLIQPLNELSDRLNRVWSPVEHLHNVADTEALREAYNSCLPKLSAYYSELGQNKRLYEAYRAIADSTDFAQLTAAQQRVISNELRDFQLSGIALPPEQQTRFKEIKQALSLLSTKFHENVLDATLAWKKHLTDEQDLAGLPETTKGLARHNAEKEGLEGWVLTLDLPCYLPVLNYVHRRDLRQEVYVAYTTRASDQGPLAGRWDNSQNMQDTLALRHELAQLLGFNNYAEYSLSTKMANSVEQVMTFLNDLAQRARPLAEKDLSELRNFAQEQYQCEQLEMWDIPYFSEKLREHRYNFSQETLRPYFPLPRVLNGFFHLLHRLYGLSVRKEEGIDVWHPDVEFYSVYDEQGELRGQVYLDMYARPGKRSGAWMDECSVRHRTAQGMQTPVAYLCCNFSPPVGKQPCLLTHQEVTTVFHEFGHGLHHILTKIDISPVSGIHGVEWDAVELPSQFMENWCWQKESVDILSGHWETGEKLPQSLFDQLLAAKNFQAGLFTLRQLEFALFDFRLHAEYHSGIDIQAVMDDVRQKVAVLIPPTFNRFQHCFSHIFSGGYAAGYYSYKWAEVLSADAFSKFEEQGIFDRATGLEFLQCVLEQGGSCHPMELFVKFRGREPSIEALLRHTGMSS